MTPLRLVPAAVATVAPSEILSPVGGSGAGGAFLPPKPHFVVAPSMQPPVSTATNVMTVPASPYSSATTLPPVAAANIIAPTAAALFPGSGEGG